MIIKGKDGFYFYMHYVEKNLDFLDEKSNISIFSRIYIGGECQYELRSYYQIDNDTRLIVLIYERLSNISSERNTQFEIYEILNFTKLNISICTDPLIDIYIPFIISEKLKKLYYELDDLGYDLFDINDKLYKDICTPYKSSTHKTDVILRDRYAYYYKNNETKCLYNCEFSYYIVETEYLKCSCDTSNNEIDIKHTKKYNPKKIIYKSFYDVLKFSNYKVLKCHKLVFIVNNLINNIGSIIVMIFVFIYLIIFVLYLIKGNRAIYYNLIKIKNQRLINKIKNNKKINQVNKIKLTETKRTKIYKKNKILIKNAKYPPKKNILVFINKTKISINNKKRNNTSNDKTFNSHSNIRLKEINKNIKNTNKKKVNIIEEKLDNYELNNLDYKKAIKLDKRKFSEIY